MSEKTYLSWADVERRAEMVVEEIQLTVDVKWSLRIYPVPRGGIFAAQAVVRALVLAGDKEARLVEEPELADIVIDDIVDSGATKAKYKGWLFFALVDKTCKDSVIATHWVVFPWEAMEKETAPRDAVIRLLEFIGEDPHREGLQGTPDRVIRSYGELMGGYGKSVEDVLTVFEEESYDEMVVLKSVEFTSMCEHHLLPFLGKAHIAYVPDGKIVGLSKLVRVLEIYSRRLQIQERICTQVTAALDRYLQPKGSACLLEARHLCMVCRGVKKQNSIMVTSSLTGVFQDMKTRQEFLSIVRG